MIVFLLSGIPQRVNDNVTRISNYSNDFFFDAKECFVTDGSTSPECKFGPKKKNEDVDLVVIGDSHAYATLSAVIDSNKNASIVFIAQSSCPAIPKIIRRSRPQCGDFMDNEFKSIRDNYKKAKVLIVNRYSQYFYGESGSEELDSEFSFNDNSSGMKSFFMHLDKEINKLGDNRKVFILMPIPDYPYDVVLMSARKAMLGGEVNIKENINRYKERSDEINKNLKKDQLR